MAKLETLALNATDPDAQRKFYCTVLGMSDRGNGRVGYSGRETAIRFVKAEAPYTPQPTDLYWKIALSIPNIELACEQLKAAGVSCSDPTQFRDVGYLAKAIDPEGFTIELIDHWFEGERREAQLARDLLGGGPCLNLVTLRTGDIHTLEPEILGWGMRPLSVQPVTPFGFTLYFYAFGDDIPPNADLTAVENRPWVYQRPYTVLEIQHVHGLDDETLPTEGHAGYGGLTISAETQVAPCHRLLVSSAKRKP